MTENEENLLMNTIEERNMDYCYFDGLINDQESFLVFFLTTDDETLISFYSYLKRLRKQLNFRRSLGEEVPELDMINSRIEYLEGNETIKNHLEAIKETQISETMEILGRKHTGFFRRLIQRRRN